MREGPETTQPKETEGESLESRDYATQREGGIPRQSLSLFIMWWGDVVNSRVASKDFGMGGNGLPPYRGGAPKGWGQVRWGGE